MAQFTVRNLEDDVHRKLRVLRQAAGIDEPELAALPLGHREMAIARGAGLIADDGLVLADHAVEERRLPHVGTADDGYDWDVHDSSPATAATG